MGTPMRNLLLSPRFISPLSPRLQVSLVQQNSTSINRTTNRLSVKKLDFENVVSPKRYNSSPIKLVVPSIKDVNEKLQKKDIVLNTPMKQKIAKDGLGHEKLLNILGKGYFGKVVTGTYKDQLVAVKVIKNTESALRERNALYLKHPNIINILDITEKRSQNYCVIIMEYYPESMHLQTYIENAENSMDKMLAFSKDICLGLEYCQSEGILHLDVKPQNILVCGDICKICDFGNSCRLDKREEFTNNGTIYYTAPELWEGSLPTEKCDIYSIGILFWYMKHRKTPYGEYDNAESVIYQVVKLDLRPDLNPPSNEYAHLYQRCWRKDPSSRPTISEVLNILENM